MYLLNFPSVAGLAMLVLLNGALQSSSAAARPIQPPKNPVEKLGPGLFRIGTIRIDTEKRELTVDGHVNDVKGIEFLANTKGGMKAYESAVTLNTDAINFNMALVLIGLDRERARPSRQHFDPAPVSGDRVQVTIEFRGPNGVESGPAEILLHDRTTNKPVPTGDWIYTGSTFYPDGRYAAEADGVLIGFAHTPSSVIESALGIALNNYGSITTNPRMPAGTALTLRVTAVSRPTETRRGR